MLQDVTKRYGRRRGAVAALDRVSLSFAAGSFTAVLGVSGSGKSTLLQCAAGLERPSAGTVRLCGTDLAGLSQRRQAVLRRRRVGFVFQDLNLLPELTVAENIALPLRLDHRPAGREDIELAAARVGLGGGQLQRRPAELSGGQQQRVAIARALVMRPKAMLFDEPTSALDIELVREVLDVMEALAREGMTMVCVTHEMRFAHHVASSVVMMDEGRVVEEAPPDQFFSAPREERTRKFLALVE
jgi:ABC-type polar amino acid transport system ATPase subunit